MLTQSKNQGFDQIVLWFVKIQAEIVKCIFPPTFGWEAGKIASVAGKIHAHVPRLDVFSQTAGWGKSLRLMAK